MNLLWIEDHYDDIRNLTDALLACNQKLTLKKSVQTAVKALKKGTKWDILFLDSFFPGDGNRNSTHSGCAIFQDLRKGKYGSWGKKVPVFFITAYGLDVDDLIGKTSPKPKYILRKPVATEDLFVLLLEKVKGLKDEMRKLFNASKGDDLIANMQDENCCTRHNLIQVNNNEDLPAIAAQCSLEAKSVREPLLDKLSLDTDQFTAVEESKTALASLMRSAVKTVMRHTNIDFPERCHVNTTALLTIQLTVDVPEGSILNQLFKIPLLEELGHVTLSVLVSALEFDLTTSMKSMRVPVNQDSDAVTFELTPQCAGVQLIEIQMFLQTERVGYFTIQCEVFE